MSKNKYSIDNILQEYSSEAETKETNNVKNDNIDSIINESEDQKETSNKGQKSEKNKKNEKDNSPKLKLSYIDRSSTRIIDKPTKINKNPKNNIRYANQPYKKTKDTNSEKSKSENLYNKNTPQKSKQKSTKNNNIHPVSENTVSIFKQVNQIQENQNKKINIEPKVEKQPSNEKQIIASKIIAKPKSSLSKLNKKLDFFEKYRKTRKHDDINVKNTPDMDFFSIDIPLNEYESNLKKPFKFSDLFKKEVVLTPENSKSATLKSPKSILTDLYDLKGNLFGKILIQLFSALASLYLVFTASYDFPIFDTLKLGTSAQAYSFVHFTLGLITSFSSLSILWSSIKKLVKFRADCDTFVSISLLIATISSFFTIFSPDLLEAKIINLFMPIAIFSFLFNTFGKLLIVNRTITNLKFVSSKTSKYAVEYMENEEKAEKMTKGILTDYPILAYMKKTNSFKDFLKYSYSIDIGDRFCKYATPILLVTSFLIATVSSYLTKSFDLASYFSIVSMVLSATGLFAISFISNLPLLFQFKKEEEIKNCVFGYQGVEDFYDTNSVIIDVEKLFPNNSITLTAIKIFSDTKIDDAIIEAASLTTHANSILKHMFLKVIDGKTKILHKVENYIYEDSMGLCGWINNKRILLGNRDLMINHSIEGLPPLSKETEYTNRGKSVVYLSISGNLSAMFVVDIKTDISVKNSLIDLINNDIAIIIRSIDSIISIQKLTELYDIPEDSIKMLPYRLQKNYEDESVPVENATASVCCNDNLSSFTDVLLKIKNIRRSSLIGLLLQMSSALIAVIFCIIFIFIKSTRELTAINLMSYNILWTIVTIIAIKSKPKI